MDFIVIFNNLNELVILSLLYIFVLCMWVVLGIILSCCVICLVFSFLVNKGSVFFFFGVKKVSLFVGEVVLNFIFLLI